MMPPALRAQVALIGLLSVLLIPIGTSSLRGLTHILTCRKEIGTPFSVLVDKEGPPVVLSSATIRPGDKSHPRPDDVCGGLSLSLQMGGRVQDRADVTLSATNHSKYGWRGSVQLRLDNTAIPVRIGAVEPGQTREDTFEVKLHSGKTYQIAGSLLVGP
jgi:hypothetical protein